MDEKIEEIKKKFAGKLIGNSKMKNLVAETLRILPTKVGDFVAKNVWFVSSFEDSWGFVLKIDEIRSKGKFVIFLGDELFEQKKENQHYEIAHEIGHVVLNHRNAILSPQTKSESQKQEDEAHGFALKYIKSELRSFQRKVGSR